MLIEDVLIQRNEQIKEALRDFANSLKPTHSIDFVYNYETTEDRKREGFYRKFYNKEKVLERRRNDLKRFHEIVERKLLGKYYYRKHAKYRIKSICHPEHLDSNPHYHGIFSIPKRYHAKFIKIADDAWKEICKSGHLEILPLITDDQRKGKISYCHKEVFKIQNYENFVLHSEFWSFKKNTCDKTTVPHLVYPR